MAFLEFLVAAARARIVTTDIFKGIAHRFLVSVTAVWTVYMAVLVVVVIVVMVAIGAMHMGLLVHRFYSAIKSGALSRKSRPSSIGILGFAQRQFLSMLSLS
ncbi:repressor [Pseudomonas syringae]|nr:repressor [Pseudomonas syringae]